MEMKDRLLEIEKKNHILYDCNVAMIKNGRRYTNDGCLNPLVVETRAYERCD